jgi:hypothetical protein
VQLLDPNRHGDVPFLCLHHHIWVAGTPRYRYLH